MEFPGALYHLTARGNAQQPIFLDDIDRTRFLHLLGQESHQQRWRCYAYCLMGNHYYLVIEPPKSILSRGLRRLHGTYTQWFNRRHRRVGPVLQGRFKSLLVDKDVDVLELRRYVVLNPMRTDLVERVRDRPWSSYRATLEGISPDWLDRDTILGLFNVSRTRAPGACQRFVAEGVGQPSPWRQVTGQIFLGGSAFLGRMARLLRGKRLANVPRAQREPIRLSSEQILQRVVRTYGVGMGALLDRSHREGYQTAVYLLRRAANTPLQAVASRFGVSSSRISKIQRAIEGTTPTPSQRQVFARCQVKYCPHASGLPREIGHIIKVVCKTLSWTADEKKVASGREASISFRRCRRRSIGCSVQ